MTRRTKPEPAPAYPDALLDAARREGDPLADEAIARALADRGRGFFAALGQGSAAVADWARTHAPELAHECLDDDPTSTPVDRAAELDARRVFARRAPDIMLLLGLYALPYCYAAARGAAVLEQTARLTGQAFTRLSETGQFVWTVLDGTPDEARAACLHVRLIHALVRNRLRHRPEGWPVAELGVPINQEDQAGTQLAFSFLITRGLSRLGLALTPTEATAYIRYHAALGRRLGVRADLLPKTLPEAYALEQAIARRQHAPSEAGRVLTQSLLGAFEGSQAPDAVRRIAPSLMAHLLGPEVAPLLGLPKVPSEPDARLINALTTLGQLRRLTGLDVSDATRAQMRLSARRFTLAADDPAHP